MSGDVFLSAPGVICGAGFDNESLWASCAGGSQAGIKKVATFSGKEFFAGRIDDALLHKTNARYDMRIIRIEDAALSQIENEINKAISDFGKKRVAVCVGSCDNGTELSFAAHEQFVKTGAFPKNYALEMQGADYVASFVAEKYGVAGPALAFSTACSSSAGAIIKGAELLKSGLADAVIAGGVDIASDTVLLGFDSLEAVSPELTNPFSANRRGITLGEGAAFFVLTKTAPHGDAVRLLGWGESADAHHMTAPDPSGEGAARAMQAALKRAELLPRDIDYINLHGTGTKANDAVESKAVAEVFDGCDTPASSTKPLMGHTLGAAGALELAVCWNALVQNARNERIAQTEGAAKSGANVNAQNANDAHPQFPLHVWDGERDETLPIINLVDKNDGTQNARRIKICMSNSFAFGGANASLIVGL